MTVRITGNDAVTALLEQVEALLKEGRLGIDFANRGVNASIALTAVQGLSAYFQGNPRRAAEDLRTAADELLARLDRK